MPYLFPELIVTQESHAEGNEQEKMNKLDRLIMKRKKKPKCNPLPSIAQQRARKRKER